VCRVKPTRSSTSIEALSNIGKLDRGYRSNPIYLSLGVDQTIKDAQLSECLLSILVRIVQVVIPQSSSKTITPGDNLAKVWIYL
jgi:hypothetical protein